MTGTTAADTVAWLTDDRTPTQRYLARWFEALAELREADRAAHPDIVDRFGRTWTWISKDLYRHDQMAWPVEMIHSSGLPSPPLADNSNYDLCDIRRQPEVTS